MEKFFTADNGIMQRVPEPELMDDVAQAVAYAGADFAEPNELFVETFASRFPAFAGRRIVDLGCGPADIAVRLARAYPACEVIAVDAAPAMLDLGRKAVDEAQLGHRVRLELARIGRETPPVERADAVVSNSLLHHLADPMDLWRVVTDLGAPGAAVLVMDLFRPQTQYAAREIVACYAADEPEILRRDFFNSLLAAYRPAEVRAQLRDAGLGQLHVETLSDRHLVVLGRLP
jgi:ubiquinone/menaquinone biosynthesis C-methylase UbiE